MDLQLNGVIDLSENKWRSACLFANREAIPKSPMQEWRQIRPEI
jgi:hypothetical protein